MTLRDVGLFVLGFGLVAAGVVLGVTLLSPGYAVSPPSGPAAACTVPVLPPPADVRS